MSDSISKSERATQERVLRLFTEGLGYRYLGDWSDRAGNHCIEEEWLTAFLARSGYSPAHISAALQKLRSEALLHGRTLYAANQAVYQLLRYGIPVKVAAGQSNESVHLVNWDQPAGNDFAIAEEVTLKGGGTVTGNTTIASGSTVSGGNSPGTTNFAGNQTWAGGGTDLFEIDDATGAQGGDPGWDFLNITGSLDITQMV